MAVGKAANPYGGHAGAILLALALASAGCALPSRDADTAAPPGPGQSRALVMAVNIEVSSLAPKAIGDTSPGRTTRVFNADLTLTDAQGVVHPYLAESLPQLNTDSWQVFPDGRMETTWRLRPGLTWHDGEPLTAEDFVLAFQVYTAPDLRAFFDPKPQDIIERVVAIDPRTIRVSWRSPFLHQGEGLTPLPSHILSEPFAKLEQDPIGQRDAFMLQPFWRPKYVGAGPYRLTNWEPASYFEGEAFDRHALGRPKIDRIVIRIINDENAVLANIMAGEVHINTAIAMRFEQAMVLQQQAGFNDLEKKGKVLLIPTSYNTVFFQFRPEYLQTPALLDLRVRKAIAHAIDKDGINEGLFSGQGLTPPSFLSPEAPYYAEADRVIAKYPYDPRRTEQLMNEAGYSKGRDGVFLGAGGDRLQPAVLNDAGDQTRKVLAIVAETWRRAGIDAQPSVLPASLDRNQLAETRATTPGMVIGSVSDGETVVIGVLTSEQIATPANRWLGANRGGWSNPDVDLLWGRYNSTLDRAEQIKALVQVLKVHSEQVPTVVLYRNLQVVCHVAGLKGPETHTTHWNIYEWEWQ